MLKFNANTHNARIYLSKISPTFILIFTIFILCGCQKINAPKTMNQVPKLRPEIEFFNHRLYPPIQVQLQETPETVTNRWPIKTYARFEVPRYVVKKFSFPVAKVINESEISQTAYYYKPKQLKPDQKVPLLLVFPILDGDHLVCEWQSKILANAGFAVIRFEKKKGFLKTDVQPEFHREIIQQTIIDARRVLDWACTLNEIDTEKIGVTGVSLGSISASLLMAADSRIQVGSFFLWGGNLPKIIATSNEVNVTRLRATLLQKQPIEKLQENLKPIYHSVDPLTYAHTFRPDNILIFSANNDKVIIPEITEEIWKASGKPNWIKLPLVGHFTAAAYFFYGNRKMTIFFKKQFGIEN